MNTATMQLEARMVTPAKDVPLLIAFDLDGTLIDSRRDLAESANELVTSEGGQPLGLDEVTGMVGEGARVLVDRVLQAAGLDVPLERALPTFLTIYERRMAIHTRCYPGIEETLASIETRASLAVLTNKPARHTHLLLAHFGIARHFRWAIGGDEAFPRKPAPAALRHLMAEAGTTSSQSLYVGDSMVDVETARRAGVRLCVAAYGFARFGERLSLDGSELVAETPAELGQRLEEWVEGRGAGEGEGRGRIGARGQEDGVGS